MKVLFIGGTGNISSAASKRAIAQGIDLFHLNRGTHKSTNKNIKLISCDINNPGEAEKALKNEYWDVVVNWIAFTPEDIKRDFELFRNKTKQYIFISSASAYQKPLLHPVVTESTPLKNPYWEYSQSKIHCEQLLNRYYLEYDFPITIVRPSLTYEMVIPVAIGSWTDYTIIDRIKKGKPIIIHGDGTSLWTITHSEDFAKGFTGLLGHQQAIGHAFHITSDEILTWNQIYEAVAQAAGSELNAIHISSEFIASEAEKLPWSSMGGSFMRGNLLGDKAVSIIFDNSKIKRFVPGFKAVIPFKEGIKNTIKWFEEDKKRMVILEENNRFIDAILDSYHKIMP